MTSLMNEFREESASPQKLVTIILFSTKRNLTHTELKKIFGVKSSKLVKVGRRYRAVCELFERLYAVKSSRIADGRYYDFDDKKWVTHFYIVKDHSYIKDFAILKYGNELLGGFDLCQSHAEELEKILQNYQSYVSLCMSGDRSFGDLSKKVSALEIADCLEKSKLIGLLTETEQSLKNFIHPMLTSVKREVDVWYQTHHWKDANSN